MSFPLYRYLPVNIFIQIAGDIKTIVRVRVWGKKLENAAVHVLYITRSLQAERLINIQCAVGAAAFRNAVCDGAFALSRYDVGEKYMYMFCCRLEMQLEN